MLQRGSAPRVEGALCKRGHPWTAENIFINQSTGHRSCRLCRNLMRQKLTRRKGHCQSCSVRLPKGYVEKRCRRCISASKQYYNDNQEERRTKAREARIALKQKVLAHYGNVCQCCGEPGFEFLTIDHVKGGGNKHRRSLKRLAGTAGFYRWLVSEGFPEGFQTLCFNCNMAKRDLPECPHKRQRATAA